MKSLPLVLRGGLRLRFQFSRAVLIAGMLLLAGSLPVVARASDLSRCVHRKVHFDGSTPLRYYGVTGSPATKLYIYPKYSETCAAGKSGCEQKGAYLFAGNDVAVGKQCGSWSYIQYIGTSRISKGWVERARLQFLRSVKTANEYWQADFTTPVPTSGVLAPPFRMTKGHGRPVCEAYLQRLNTTDYQLGHAYPQVPYDGIPESDSIPGFVLLHRVPLQPSTIIQISGPLERWWEKISPLRGVNWDATPEQVKLGGIVAWRYDPPLDINNDGRQINLVVWRGYGLSGASGRCGEPLNPNYTWNMRCQQLPLIMKDDLHINYVKTAEIFGRISAKGSSRRNDSTTMRHPFIPVGFFITPFVYRGTTYFSVFFDGHGDYEGKRQGIRKLWNTLGVLVRYQGRTREVCEYQLSGDDYPAAHTGLEK